MQQSGITTVRIHWNAAKKEEQKYLKSMLEDYLLLNKYHPFEVDQIIEWIRK